MLHCLAISHVAAAGQLDFLEFTPESASVHKFLRLPTQSLVPVLSGSARLFLFHFPNHTNPDLGRGPWLKVGSHQLYSASLFQFTKPSFPPMYDGCGDEHSEALMDTAEDGTGFCTEDK